MPEDVRAVLNEILKAASPAAARALVESLKDPEERVRAASIILDRVLGRAVQPLEVSGPEGGPVEIAGIVAGLTVEELREIVRRGRDPGAGSGG